jgi:ATP-dependent 26S proteasome regulatory subunit
LGQITDEWRSFAVDLLSFARGELDSRKNVDSLIDHFDSLNSSYAYLGLSRIGFFALIFYVCKDFYQSVEELIAKTISSSERSSRLTYRDIVFLAGFIFPGEIDTAELLSDSSLLNEIYLEPEREIDKLSITTPMRLENAIESFASGSEIPMGRIGTCCRCQTYEDLLLQDADIICHRQEIDRIWSIVKAMVDRNENGIIYLKGNAGYGKKFAAGKIACQLKKGLITVSLSDYLSFKEVDRKKIIKRIKQKCLLENYIYYIDCNNEDITDHNVYRSTDLMLMFLGKIFPLVLMGGKQTPPDNMTSRQVMLTEFTEVSEENVIDLFRYFIKEKEAYFSEDISLEEIASKYRLSPGQVSKVLDSCLIETDEISKETLEKNIRNSCTVSFDGLATRLESRFTFEDLTLSEESEKSFRNVIDRVRYKNTVLEKYGFNEKLPYGRGLVIALYGPPGTGKTMTANVLANELGLDIYRIDLSQISSKYVGESEKNLGAVFEAARGSNVVLFFDEADALFAKRTEVSTAGDKYSNSETAFLLQKMEEYDGISILATNVMQNFDSAFKRRITFMISLLAPDEQERLALWKKVFPKKAPLASDVKFEVYARCADIPGSSIKSAAVAAAYRAASRNSEITHEDLCHAIDEEYKKTGHTSILRDLLYGN